MTSRNTEKAGGRFSAAREGALRALPFAVFSGKRKMPPWLERLGTMLPSAVMAALLVYCFRNALTAFDLSGGAKVLSAVVTALVYRLRHNTLLAVAAGTALCMALSALI